MKLAMAGLALALLTACSVEDIVAGRMGEDGVMDSSMPEDAGSADAGPSGKPCRDRQECASNEFCERSGCGPVLGQCRTRPIACDSIADPVCGCDGVTYYNDCLRQQTRGVPRRDTGECSFGSKPCGGGGRGCGPGEFCAQLVPEDAPLPCPPSPPGTCWVVPTVCDPAGGSRFNACDGAPLMCMDACQAIRSGHPHKFARDCPTP